MSIYKQFPNEYQTWAGMKQRCYNPNETGFKVYGGSGVQVCDRWRTSFELFIEDMGQKPKPSYHIHRKNPHGDYCKDNCIWLEPHEHMTLPKGKPSSRIRKVTKRQKEIFEFMSASRGRVTYRDIAAKFEISPKGAYDHVAALIRKGLIEKKAKTARSFIIVLNDPRAG